MKKQICRFVWNCCEQGKHGLNGLQRRVSDTHHNPWRCEACGSKNISYRAWVDGNTEKMLSAADDRDDLWCDDCEEHTYQIRECDLMRKTVEPWWADSTTDEEREVVTGFCSDGFAPEDNGQSFRDVCNAWWNRKSTDEKIRIWRQATRQKE